MAGFQITVRPPLVSTLVFIIVFSLLYQRYNYNLQSYIYK